MNDASTSSLPLRQELADLILRRFDADTRRAASAQFAEERLARRFIVDDLLPSDIARAIYHSFPDPATMRERRTLREHKYVAAQMDRYQPQAREALFSFQDPRVVDLFAEITQIPKVEADPTLYAGGISLMSRGNFLNPHLDNSHNSERTRYRVLNLLYYVSPNWSIENGGNLELWPNGIKREPEVIRSAFNRLVVMATGLESWHSVTAVRTDQPRCCVSNYYFSEVPLGERHYTRVTTFRGRPEQPVRDLVLHADAVLRQWIRKVRPQGLVEPTHIYKERDAS